MSDTSFQRFGGAAAAALAVCSALYALLLFLGTDSVALVARLERIVELRGLNQPANLLLGIVGLLATVAVTALYERSRTETGAWMRWATTLGVFGAVMTAVHGFWDFMRTPVLLAQWDRGIEGRRDAISAFAGVPNPVDPRGLGAFLLLGLFVLVAARHLARDRAPDGLLGPIGLAYGFLLVVLFLAGLVGPAGVRAALAGLTVGVVGPVWWLLVARMLLRADHGRPPAMV